MAIYSECGHSTSYEPGKTFEGLCYSCRFTSRIGQRILVARFGSPVEFSFNHRDNCPEKGMSCYEVKFEMVNGTARIRGFVDTVRAEFSDRPLYLGWATLIDSGSDDEPIVANFAGRLATDKEKESLGL